jgi:ATP-dependent DNA ligase
MMARRDTAGVRLLTRRGNNWTQRYPLIAAAVDALVQQRHTPLARRDRTITRVVR